MPPEVQDTIAAGQEMLDNVQKKKEEFDKLISETQDKLDKLESEYVGRSKQFIESKRVEIANELETKKRIIEDKIKEMNYTAQSWLDTKKNELIKKSTENAAKILTGLNTPQLDPSDEN